MSNVASIKPETIEEEAIRERNRRREREAADMPTVHARILTFPKAA